MAMRRMISVSRRGSAGIWSAMGRQRALSETNPRLSNRPYPRPTSSRGAAIRRHAAWRGGGGALRPGLHPGLGRLRGTALGVLRRLCEELAGRLGISEARRGTDDEAMSRTDPWNAPGMRSPSRISAARGFQIAGKRSATGRAEGDPSAPHPGSTEAASYLPRLAALRCPSSINERGDAGG